MDIDPRKTNTEITALAFFNQHWTEIKDVLDYDDEWETVSPPNRYKKMAIKDPFIHGSLSISVIKFLPPGKLFKSMSDTGRRIIFIGTRCGPIVLYTHHSLSGDLGVYFYVDARLRQFNLVEDPHHNLIVACDAYRVQYFLGATKNKKIPNLSAGEIKYNRGIAIESLFRYLNKNGAQHGNSNGSNPTS